MARWTSLTVVLLATSCAPGGRSTAPALRVDEGKLAGRMALLHRLTEEPQDPGDTEERTAEDEREHVSSSPGPTQPEPTQPEPTQPEPTHQGTAGAGPEPLASPDDDR